MAYDSLHKGYYGTSYRSKIGLHRTSLSADGSYTPSPADPLWDIYIGPLPFLIANNDDRPYLRETVPVRRDRTDQAREPGENSLDSNIWLRSQTSWHLGAGQAYAEPLEEDAEIARFRFYQSGGVDPWTPGSLSLLPEVAQRDTGARQCIGVPSRGVVVSTNSAGVRLYGTAGLSTALSSKTVTKLTASNNYWYGLSTAGLEYGLLSTGGEGGIAAANATALHWGKDRLWMAVGAATYEFTTVNPSTLPTAHYTFKSGSVVDIDSGAGGVYWLVNDAFTSVYVSTVKDDGTLNVPREVAKLPRGETGNFLYCYLDRYLVIGTSAGVRVADCSSATDLPIGPVIVELEGGCLDAAGNGDYIWFTGGTTGVTPTAGGTASPGLYRMDLSRQVSSTSAYGDTAAARFAYASDMYTTAVAGQAYSVTSYGGDIFFTAGPTSVTANLFQQQDTLVDSGWLESGQISFSTAERKTWLSFSVDVSGPGYFQLDASTGVTFSGVTQTQIESPFTNDLDVDVVVHGTSGWLAHRITLTGSGTGQPAESPTLLSLGLRATPAPKRTRYVRLPLKCYDSQIDRNNNPVGYKGFGYDRLKDLEDLEQVGGLITVVDQRTGETLRCQVDKVSYEGTTPPSRDNSNFSGVVTVTLLTV